MTLFLSNRLDYLAKDLKNNLFKNSSFFSKRILVFPNSRVKEAIYQMLANDPDLKVAFGITPLYLNEAIDLISDHFFISSSQKKSLSPTQLIFKIEETHGGSFKECSTLANLFERRALYGTPQTKEPIWDAIFSEYTYPFERLSHLKEKEGTDSNYTFHFFGFSYLPPLYFSLIQRLSKKISTFLYILSPCQEFWSDIKSDKETSLFFSKSQVSEKLQTTLEEYLEDRHPLLANLGKVGRELAKIVEDSDLQTVEHYVETSEDTNLHALQHSLLFLKEDTNTFDDDTIQIHIVTTPHREIEVLYNNLLHFISEKKIEPKDILVMAPDIAVYEPYISACFTKIPFRICDMPISTQDQEIHALFNLFSLEEKRWSASSVMSLLSNPLFKKKQGWNDDDIETIKKWIEIGNIRWGFDLNHVNRLLKNKHCQKSIDDESHTWSIGFKRLYKNFAEFEEVHEMDILDSELLGKLNGVIFSLFKDLSLFYEETEKTVQDWIALIKETFSKYVWSEESLFSKLDVIKKSAFSKKYTFNKLFPLISDFLSKEKVTLNAHQVEGVTFCSAFPMRPLPAKVVYLLGMQLDAFPRKERKVALDFFKNVKGFCPTITDTDRFLFLEALLSAKDYFIISYLGKSLEDQSFIPESSVVFEFLRALKNKPVVVHPDTSIDPLYFKNSHRWLKNYSEKDFQKAVNLVNPKKTPPPFFIKKNSEPLIPEGEHTIDINELRRICRYPITSYLKQKAHINFFEEKTLEDEEKFLLSAKDLGKAKKKILNTYASDVMKRLEKKGEAPLAYFNKLSLFRLKNEEEKKESFQTFSTLEFSSFQKEKLKPFFDYDEKRKISFVGKIENVTKVGLFTFDRCSLSSAVKHFSDFILLNWASQTKQNLFFGKDKKEKTPFFTDVTTHLKILVDFYFFAQKEPLFLLPEWVEAILERDRKKLEKGIEEKNSFDEGALFATRRNLNSSDILETSAEFCDKLYKDMKDAWF